MIRVFQHSGMSEGGEVIQQKSEGWMLIEDFSVQMYTDVCFHVFWTVVQHLQNGERKKI